MAEPPTSHPNKPLPPRRPDPSVLEDLDIFHSCDRLGDEKGVVLVRDGWRWEL